MRLRLTGDFTILIADRNPHVREFLRREMAAEGYRVCLARNARELLEEGLDRNGADLLILDPDLPGIDLFPLLRQIERRRPFLTVVVHALPDDQSSRNPVATSATFIEKGGSSIEHLKRVVAEARRHRHMHPSKS
jgi:DNA-binding response OmpR family regulator